MGIEALKTMKEQIVSCVQGQLGDLKNVNAEQLGEAVDMIKDLSQAIYYCTITEAMEEKEKGQTPINNINYYTSTTPAVMRMTPEYYRERERNDGYMYYPSNGYMYYQGDGNSNSGGNRMGGRGNSSSYYTEPSYGMMRDPREGRAAIRRRMYMQGKEMHKDPKSQLNELEAYLQELSTDITEMIKDASPEEKATLHQKMTILADKLV